MWEKGSNVKFLANKKRIMVHFLNELSKKASQHDIKIYVTSGYRSPEEQARVVCENTVNTGGENLSVYGKKTRQMYRDFCPHDKPTLVSYETERLAKMIAKDPNYQGHGTGWSLDLSIRNLSQNQKIKLKEIMESMGAQVLWETAPPHFHVWLRNYKAPTVSWPKIAIFCSSLLTSVLLVYPKLTK